MSFVQEIQACSGQNVNLCFQCSKCSSGCPLGERMDFKPAQLMHHIRLGHRDIVLNSQTIWLCLGCETCAARCPQGVEPAAVMCAARILANREGIKPKLPLVAAFYASFVENMTLYGRISDLMLVAALRLRGQSLFGDMPLAVKLLERGKLNPLQIPSGASDFRRIYERVQALEGAEAKSPGV